MSCRMGCEEPVVAKGLCERCYKRERRGGDMTAPRQERLSPRARAVEAAIAFVDADTDDDKAADRAAANLEIALARWRDPLVMAAAGKRGGQASGAGRLVNLSPERRSQIASLAARARAAKMDPVLRRRIAKQAAQARWKSNACLSAEASMQAQGRRIGK